MRSGAFAGGAFASTRSAGRVVLSRCTRAILLITSPLKSGTASESFTTSNQTNREPQQRRGVTRTHTHVSV